MRIDPLWPSGIAKESQKSTVKAKRYVVRTWVASASSINTRVGNTASKSLSLEPKAFLPRFERLAYALPRHRRCARVCQHKLTIAPPVWSRSILEGMYSFVSCLPFCAPCFIAEQQTVYSSAQMIDVKEVQLSCVLLSSSHGWKGRLHEWLTVETESLFVG